ncbi:dihydrofolate reductase [Candidatus Blochmannia ocreatus (nom. nud.)]|uniref:Dihydrofolate reductase n=1 Tax=Candidatus Blochmannia ocreatus (nom. nud.) TaxID=251538 RepID=A0ABY4SV35_9ENTR|nr:dihydrofolate reductase [Candidatus Blochmannia ocreatus]URJ25207.1 dihydrofolate reductase [Candidatus Blochmannia ocreatus]
MIISLIVALTSEHIIGNNNKIPWNFPEDIKWFKYHTIYKPIIMGRKTFESLGKKPLLNRYNIVLSNRLSRYNYHNVFIANNLYSALSVIKNKDEIMIIGGGAIYKIFFPYAQRLYLTYINSKISIEGDTWFPWYNRKEWVSILDYSYKTNKYNCFELNFQILKRR